jgi:cell wall assembly regulator SMI1
MPIPRIIRSGPPVTEAKLAQLEKQIGATLPQQYREFLLQNNGGRPVPNTFRDEKRTFSSDVEKFFGVGTTGQSWDLLAQLQQSREELPAELMPVARDEEGNIVCLVIKGSSKGKIYFQDNASVVSTEPSRELLSLIFSETEQGQLSPARETWPGDPDLHLIADNFNDFLGSLFEDHDKCS